MLQGFIEAALEAEMEAHLDDHKREGGNKRRKTIKSSAGSFEIETPQVIKKRETVLADSLQDKIIGLYGLGDESAGHQLPHLQNV